MSVPLVPRKGQNKQQCLHPTLLDECQAAREDSSLFLHTRESPLAGTVDSPNDFGATTPRGVALLIASLLFSFFLSQKISTHRSTVDGQKR
ncbi:hypothetical protein CEXT_561611 [Caerostris extrusa]|uniref:Uncharacterized protein n=1 Tax=Caerostris extrusa TaxID=172846 RepID=A0AAV4WQJ7_CAEEX|nr:hypothetical protein CEXT_561611 [Caerostris extrusa]